MHRLWGLRAGLSGLRDFALDDLLEKRKHYAELNADYVQSGKFTPGEYTKYAAK